MDARKVIAAAQEIEAAGRPVTVLRLGRELQRFGQPGITEPGVRAAVEYLVARGKLKVAGQWDGGEKLYAVVADK